MSPVVRCIFCVIVGLSLKSPTGSIQIAYGGEKSAAPTRAAGSSLDPQQPISAERGKPITYQIDFSAVVTAPYHTKKLKVWMPLPQSDAGQEISGRQLSTFPMRVEPNIAKETVHGNEFAYFEFDHPEGAQIIRHRFQAVVRELNWQFNPTRVSEIETWPKEFAAYLKPQESLAVKPEFRKSLLEIVPQRKGEVTDLFAVMNWVDQNLKYDHVKASLRGDAQFAFEERRGHCSDYHGLCSTMGRALGYPTRVTYGINLFPKNSPSHCKFEAYLPPYGWVSFDVSETQRLVAAIQADAKLTAVEKTALTLAARSRFKAGFRDNTWLLLTKGTDYDLMPKAVGKVPVVRTIYAEADGVPLPDPDPANPQKREFGWMTVHDYQADQKVTYPFKDWSSLKTPNSKAN